MLYLVQISAFVFAPPYVTVECQVPGKPTQGAEADLSRLVEQLNSRDFRARQRATKELKAAGARAIPLLQRRLRSGGLELAARAMSIFERAYVGTDVAAVSAADAALEELADSKRQALAEMARAVLRRNSDIRATIAIRHLTRLNADFWDTRAEAALRIPAGRPGAALNPGIRFERELPRRLILDSEWTGGVAGLKYVRRLVNSGIHIYVIDGFPVPEKDKVELEAAFPDNSVVRRGAVMLGVSASPFGPGVVVSGVQKFSSGWGVLKDGDRLTKLDGEELQDFSDLIAILKEHKVGDEVVFEVETVVNNELTTEERKVTLKNWRLPRKKPEKAQPPERVPEDKSPTREGR